MLIISKQYTVLVTGFTNETATRAIWRDLLSEGYAVPLFPYNCRFIQDSPV